MIKVFDKQLIYRSAIGSVGRTGFEKHLPQSLNLIVAFNKKEETFAFKVSDTVKCVLDDRHEFFDVGPGFTQHFLKEKQKIIRRLHLDCRSSAGVDGIGEDGNKKTRGVTTFGMPLQEVKIIQGIPPGFLDNKIPVSQGMGKFPQENINTLDKPIVL